MGAEADDERDGANVLGRIREDDDNLRDVLESFSDGVTVGVLIEGPYVVLGLRVAGDNWPAHVSQVESRLDRLNFDWRASVTCVRPV
jgi:hypothetical protein